MKKFVYFIICGAIILCNTSSFAQNKNDSLLLKSNDTNHLNQKKKAVIKRNITDTTNEPRLPAGRQKIQIPILADSLKTIKIAESTKNINSGNAIIDSAKNKPDSLLALIATQVNPQNFITNRLLLTNRFINIKDAPVYFIEKPHNTAGKEFLFYTLCVVLLILGIFKTIFSGYFKNLFRVYFNTSLRQTQLADQLEQAKLPSFIMNIFFAITAGIYIWLLFNHFHPPRLISSKLLLPFCILSVAVLYFIKFCLLKFMGWVSDIQETTNTYIFAIFLVNKITGIILVPIIILLAFLNSGWLPVVTNISLMILGLFFLSRYLKSYGAIERKIPLNAFHFIIYIAAAEIIPLLLIYKVAVDYLI